MAALERVGYARLVMADASALERVLRRVRRRMWLQHGIDGAGWGVMLGGGGMVLGLVVWRLGFGQRFVWGAMVMLGTCVFGAVMLALARSLPIALAAQTVDRACVLRDRVASALEFTRGSMSDPFRAAAVADAERHLALVDARRVVPFRRPRQLRACLLLGVAAVATWLVQPLDARSPRGAAPSVAASIAPDDLVLGRLAADELANAPQAEIHEMRDLGVALRALYDELATEQRTPEEWLARVEALERRVLRDVDGASERRALREALGHMGEVLLRERPTRDVGEALREDDFDKAKAALEDLAQQTATMGAQPKRHLKRALDRAARSLAAPEQPKWPQLERLQRDLERGAEAERSEELEKALQDLAKDVGQFEDEHQKLEAAERVRFALADLKEALRGGSERGRGSRSQENRAGRGTGGQLGRIQEFLRRAGRQGARREGTGASRGSEPGTGIGDRHDPRLGGSKDIDAQHRNVRVDGAESRGPSRSEVIASASQEGFSTLGYKRVYRDYATVMEEVLDSEDVAPGQRQQVKRYFELIHPNP